MVIWSVRWAKRQWAGCRLTARRVVVEHLVDRAMVSVWDVAVVVALAAVVVVIEEARSQLVAKGKAKCPNRPPSPSGHLAWDCLSGSVGSEDVARRRGNV